MSRDYYVVFWDCIQALHFGLHDDCSHEIKRHLFLKRKPVTELDSTFKSRDITLPTKVRNNNVQMWELDHKEGWAPKNWCFWIVVLEKTLKSPLDCKEIQPVHPERNQSWIFTEGLMLKLKLQYCGHLMQRTDSLEKTLVLGKTEGGRRRGWQRMRWPDTTERLSWVGLKCMAMPLCCPLDTSTTLLINYSPIQS